MPPLVRTWSQVRAHFQADVTVASHGSRVHSPMPYHAGSHHPGSLMWPCDRLLVPVDAVFSWRRILCPGRFDRQGGREITTVPQPNLNRCGADRAESRAYAPNHGAHRTNHDATSRLLAVLGPRGAAGAGDLRVVRLPPRDARRRHLVALRRTRKSGCARLHHRLRRAGALRARRLRRSSRLIAASRP